MKKRTPQPDRPARVSRDASSSEFDNDEANDDDENELGDGASKKVEVEDLSPMWVGSVAVRPEPSFPDLDLGDLGDEPGESAPEKKEEKLWFKKKKTPKSS